MVFAITLYAGHASAQPQTQCTNTPATRPPAVYAAKQPPAPIAVETTIWKTITVGGSKGVNAIRVAIEAAPCPMAIGDEADEALGRPAFPFFKTSFELDLVVLSAFDLGFGDETSRNDPELGASVDVSLHDIYARAVALGFELCPAEVGPALRLNYLDQPLDEFLRIAMKPVALYSGALVAFTVGNGGAELLLGGRNGHPDVKVPGATRFVFVRPRHDTLAGGIMRQSSDDLAKR
jgi:hypothetical protein